MNALSESARAFERVSRDVELERARVTLAAAGSVLEGLKALKSSTMPEDRDILYLIKFLDELGEADRAQIERRFARCASSLSTRHG